MAEARQNSGDLARPVIADSAYVYEYYCLLCQEEGRHLEADGYCQNCREYLCKTCFDGHCTPRPFRHHILISKQNMPKDTSLLAQSKVNKDKSTEKCLFHPEEFIQYYCQDDDTLGCHICITKFHRYCTGPLYIPDVSSGICESREFKDLFKDLNLAKDRTAVIINAAKNNRSDIKKYHHDVMKSMQKFRKHLNTTLDKLEWAVREKADKLKSEDEKKMKTISDNNNKTTLKNIEAMITSLAMLQSNKQECNLFVAMKKIMATTESLLLNLDQAEQGNNIRKYEFQPGIELQKLLKDKDAFGEISLMDDTDTQTAPAVTSTSTRVLTTGAHGKVNGKATPTRQAVKLSPMDENKGRSPVIPSVTAAPPPSTHTINLQVRHVANIKVRSGTDQKDCLITGAVALQDNKVVITDYANAKVKVLDTTSNQILSEVKLSDEPWDITRISSREFGVTLPYFCRIVFLNLIEDNTMTEGRSLSVNGSCRGIVCRKEQLVVSYAGLGIFVSYPIKVEILSLNGEVQHTIDTDSTGGQLFDLPRYLAISPDQDTIYVSDFNSHTVTSLSATGQVKAIYKDDQLERPTGLTTDTEGRVYVSCENNHIIHVITANCEKIKILHTKDTGLDSNPWALCFCEVTNNLLVGMNSNNVNVYQMT